MKEKFCVKCGKETTELINGLCKNCFKEREGIAEIPEEVEISSCKGCGRFKLGDEWKSIGVEEAVDEKIKERVEFRKGAKGRKVNVNLSQDLDGGETTAKGSIEDVELEESRTVKVEVSEEMCDRCAKRKSGYFEAKLQIRGSEEMVEEALELSKKVLKESRDKEAFVSEFEEVEGGVDIYLGSNSAAKNLASNIASEFLTERKDTKSLQGVKEGERVYRSTYLVRILE